MKVLVCIPARYGSIRFPAKVLAKDTGKFLIQHTYQQACKAKLADKVIIAADDNKIVDAADSFGAHCVLTSDKHQSGTDRIAEAIKKLTTEDTESAENKLKLSNDDIIINLQADEPEIDPDNIDIVTKLLIDNPDYQMATLAADFQNIDQIKDPNIVKVITNGNNKAIYFSRSVVPYDRENNGVGDLKNYLRHLGIYAYRKDFLLKFTTWPQSRLEKIEKLEQLRAVENGYDILVSKVTHSCDGIDTPQQYAEFVKREKNEP